MKLLVTGSSGHLGEALVRTLRAAGHAAAGLDITPSPQTDLVGSITDRGLVRRAMSAVDSVLHTAALHKPHIVSHSRQDFVDTNVTGTLTLLEEALAARVASFVLTSTTSVFGDALRPPPGSPAAWITEEVTPIPKNIYGVTKVAAEDLCQLFHRNHGLPCIVLRTSRFFPEPDDDESRRMGFDDTNLKVNELLCRRADIEDMVSAHVAALDGARRLGFGKFIISATTPFERRTWPSCAVAHRWLQAGAFRASKPSSPLVAGRCSRRSTACMSTSARGGCLDGYPSMTLPVRCRISRKGGFTEVNWRRASRRRAITADV